MLRRLLVLLMLVGGYFTSYGQNYWQMAKGLNGGNVLCVASDSTGILYGGTTKGLYRSIDGGAVWSICTPTSYYVCSIAIASDGVIYIGNFDNLYRSTNHGETWEYVTNSTDGSLIATIHIGRSGAIYFGAMRLAVIYSTDNGASWNWTSLNQIIGPYYFDFVYSIYEISADTIIAGSQAHGLFITTDRGQYWRYYGSYYGDVNRINKCGNNNFVVGTDDGIYKLHYPGGEMVPIGLQGKNVRSLSISEDSVFSAGTDSEFMISSDRGETWSDRTNPNMGVTRINDLAALQTGTLLVATGGYGIYKARNFGSSWDWISNGMPAYSFNDIASNANGTLFAGSSGAGIYKSFDGNNWIPSSKGLTNAYVWALHPIGDSIIIAATNNGVCRSINSGDSWIQVGIPGKYVRCLTGDGGNNILAGIYGTNYNESGLYRSTDKGKTWFRDSLPTYDIRTFLRLNDGTLFAGTTIGVFRAVNFGGEWTRLNLTKRVLQMAHIPPDEIWAVVDYEGLYRSQDRGDTWKYSGFKWTEIRSIFINSGCDIFAGYSNPANATNFQGPIISRDLGLSWDTIATGLDDYSVNSFFSNKQGFLYASTGKGIAKSTAVVASGELERAFSNHCYLSQNYPNPFNPTTWIGYHVSGRREQVSGNKEQGSGFRDEGSGGRAVMKVYDVLGREVATLVDEVKAAGSYEVEFNAAGLPSGVYFYTLRAGTFAETKKLMLLR